MEQLLDVSGLEPPEPLEQILDALADLPQGDWLRIKHRRDPVPLYSMLAKMDYQWETHHLGPDDFEILIWPKTLSHPVG